VLNDLEIVAQHSFHGTADANGNKPLCSRVNLEGVWMNTVRADKDQEGIGVLLDYLEIQLVCTLVANLIAVADAAALGVDSPRPEWAGQCPIA
jgi:hypothetical protein